MEKLKSFPIPGIEPGPPGWEPGILTTRQYGMCEGEQILLYILKLTYICTMIFLPLLWVCNTVLS